MPLGTKFSSHFFFFFFRLTYSRWTSSIPSCLWSQRIFLSLPGSRLTFFLSRCKFSTLTARQPMVEFYLLTFPRFPLRKKEHKSYFGKNRTHDFRTSRCAAYLLDHSGDERVHIYLPIGPQPNPVIDAVAIPVRDHKEVRRSTGHIMATTRYSNQLGSPSRENPCQVQPTEDIGNLSASRRCLWVGIVKILCLKCYYNSISESDLQASEKTV